MGKLKGRGIGSRIGAPTSRLGGDRSAGADGRAARPAEPHWRRWYKTARWQRLRAEVIKRDGLVCCQTGVLLVGKHPAWNSPAIDHKVPHRGDPSLFWDPANLQVVSKEWHDKVKQRMERAGEV